MGMISSALASATVVGAAVAGVAYLPDAADVLADNLDGAWKERVTEFGGWFDENVTAHVQTVGKTVGTNVTGHETLSEPYQNLSAIMTAAIGAAGLGGILGANMNGGEEPAPGHLTSGPQNGGGYTR